MLNPQVSRRSVRQKRSPAPPRSPSLPADLWRAVRSSRARPLRFVIVGGSCGLLQLALLIVLEGVGLGALAANVLAYLLSAQLNFVLSDRFIWGDRCPAEGLTDGLMRRWAGFHCSIAATFLLNQLVFVAALALLPDVLASAAGIGISAIVNFVIQDRLTFQRRQ